MVYLGLRGFDRPTKNFILIIIYIRLLQFSIMSCKIGVKRGLRGINLWALSAFENKRAIV